MSAHILQTIYALNIHLLTLCTRGFFILTPYQYLFHNNLLLVEAGGIAPPSSMSFNLFHQTVLYLYHAGIYLSRTKLRFLQIFFLIQIYQLQAPNLENLDLHYQLPKQHLLFRHGLYSGLMLSVLETA